LNVDPPTFGGPVPSAVPANHRAYPLTFSLGSRESQCRLDDRSPPFVNFARHENVAFGDTSKPRFFHSPGVCRCWGMPYWPLLLYGACQSSRAKAPTMQMHGTPAHRRPLRNMPWLRPRPWNQLVFSLGDERSLSFCYPRANPAPAGSTAADLAASALGNVKFRMIGTRNVFLQSPVNSPTSN